MISPLDPGAVGLAADGLDHQAEQAVAVVRVLEAGAAPDHRRRLELRAQLGCVEKRAPVDELAGVGPVAHHAGGVRKELGERCARERRMQPADVAPHRVREPQPLLLPQLHDAGGGEALRVRRDAKQVARRERRALHGIGVAERGLEHDAPAVRDRHRAAGLLVQPHLELEPARQIVDRRFQPGRALHSHEDSAATTMYRPRRPAAMKARAAAQCIRSQPAATQSASPTMGSHASSVAGDP